MVAREDLRLYGHHIPLDHSKPLLLKANLQQQEGGEGGSEGGEAPPRPASPDLVHVDVSGGNILIASRNPLVLVGTTTPLPKVLHLLRGCDVITGHVSTPAE